MDKLRPSAHGVTFTVKVTPRASRTQIEGWHEDMLKVRLHAPPVDGKANEKIIEVLAEYFKKPKRCITILHGATSKQKVIEVAE